MLAPTPLATEALQRIAALYRIEATVPGQLPMFADLKTWLERT